MDQYGRYVHHVLLLVTAQLQISSKEYIKFFNRHSKPFFGFDFFCLDKNRSCYVKKHEKLCQKKVFEAVLLRSGAVNK